MRATIPMLSMISSSCSAVPRSQKGFTLIELIIVMVIISILAVSAGMMFVAPMRAYLDVSRRAQLVDLADTSLHLMQRELRAALPNSIRIDGTGTTIEFVPVLYAGRYRANLPGDMLDFTAADSSFAVLASDVPSPTGSAYVVVFPFDAAAIYNSASSEHVRTALGSTTSSSVTLSSAFQFGHTSPAQRFYLVSQPVKYICSGGSITRYDSYGFSAVQSTAAQGTDNVLVQNVGSCAFTYSAGTANRAAVATLKLTLRDAASAEQVSLLEQVHVDNAP